MLLSPGRPPKVADKKSSDTPATPRPGRKRAAAASPVVASDAATGEAPRSSKRSRKPASVYQSPSIDPLTSKPRKEKTVREEKPDDLTVFFRNEYLAVRNPDAGFYLCQACQNVKRRTTSFSIRWLDPHKDNPDLYSPDYYDKTDLATVLTNVTVERKSGGIVYLSSEEKDRVMNILTRAIDKEKGVLSPLAEDHPDGLDLSLYNDESQLKKRKRKGGFLVILTTF